MNIFYLSHNPVECAKFHVDRHTTKMVLEYAQLLSTAHRVLDGVELNGLSASGRKKKFWTLGDSRDYTLYKATHINHPSAVWVRKSAQNYMWLAEMLEVLCGEYTYRYGKVHKVERDGLMQLLKNEFPKNLPIAPFTEPTPAMPDDVKVSGDSIKSYRNYYINNKAHLANWKKRTTPEWYIANV